MTPATPCAIYAMSYRSEEEIPPLSALRCTAILTTIAAVFMPIFLLGADVPLLLVPFATLAAIAPIAARFIDDDDRVHPWVMVLAADSVVLVATLGITAT